MGLQDEAGLDRLFLALASTTRRQILDVVHREPGCTVARVAEHFPISRVAVLKHVNVLEEAGLLASRRVGRERELWFDPVPLRLVHERWSEQYSDFWASRLTRLKYAVEREKA
jgi:predicted transcriptional regulator